MKFIADKQTLDDLNITGKYKPGSIYQLFNNVKTKGGEYLLDSMFQHPLSDAGAINSRCETFRFFEHRKLRLPFDPSQFVLMENYLNSVSNSNLPMVLANTIRKKIFSVLLNDQEFNALAAGIRASLSVLRDCQRFFRQLDEDAAGNGPYGEQLSIVREIFSNRQLGLFLATDTENMTVLNIARYDLLLRYSMQTALKKLLGLIYHLDVCLAVSAVAAENGFCYPTAYQKQENMLAVKQLYHPAIKKGIANNLSLNQGRNLLFLTGANMAGKSTFMKSFGIAVYLAHMGFPVAADEMQFSIKDGLYSSINVPDDISQGYSHFYAEVLRVKKVAEEVGASKDLVVIFDELFKGTNVKDAYDATLAVTQAFSENRNCFFIVSTHIIEVGEALKTVCNNLQFSYLPTVMDGYTPRYTYRLQEGITSDRHGMMIIENENILEIIQGVARSTSH